MFFNYLFIIYFKLVCFSARETKETDILGLTVPTAISPFLPKATLSSLLIKLKNGKIQEENSQRPRKNNCSRTIVLGRSLL